MPDKKLFSLLRRLSKQLPHFPDGRLDLIKANPAPVINCFVSYKGKFLILKRSRKVYGYKGRWCCVGGYLDEFKSPKHMALKEIGEELRISKSNVKKARVFKEFKISDKKAGLSFLVFPIHVELKKQQKIKLDWEHTDYRWIYPEEAEKFNLIRSSIITLKIITSKR